MSICNKDCFHCPYPDCINDDMDHEDYVEAAERDRELRSTPEKRKIAAQHKAYYKANREKVAAQQRIIRETRISVGLSQATAANILGVSRTTIYFWENGNVPCDTAAVVLALHSAIQEKPPAEREARQAERQLTHEQNNTFRRISQ